MTAGPRVAVGESVAVGVDELAPELGLRLAAGLVMPAPPCPETDVVQPLSNADAASSTNTRRERTARV